MDSKQSALLMRVLGSYALMHAKLWCCISSALFLWQMSRIFLPTSERASCVLFGFHLQLTQKGRPNRNLLFISVWKIKLRWICKCARNIVLKRTKVYGVPHSMRQQQFVRCTCCNPRRIPRSALIKWSTIPQNTITNAVTFHCMQFNVRILASLECSSAPTCVLHL